MPRYDLELKDSDLISEVLSNLSRPWLLATDRMWTGRVAHGLRCRVSSRLRTMPVNSLTTGHLTSSSPWGDSE